MDHHLYHNINNIDLDYSTVTHIHTPQSHKTSFLHAPTLSNVIVGIKSGLYAIPATTWNTTKNILDWTPPVFIGKKLLRNMGVMEFKADESGYDSLSNDQKVELLKERMQEQGQTIDHSIQQKDADDHGISDQDWDLLYGSHSTNENGKIPKKSQTMNTTEIAHHVFPTKEKYKLLRDPAIYNKDNFQPDKSLYDKMYNNSISNWIIPSSLSSNRYMIPCGGQFEAFGVIDKYDGGPSPCNGGSNPEANKRRKMRSFESNKTDLEGSEDQQSIEGCRQKAGSFGGPGERVLKEPTGFNMMGYCMPQGNMKRKRNKQGLLDKLGNPLSSVKNGINQGILDINQDDWEDDLCHHSLCVRPNIDFLQLQKQMWKSAGLGYNRTRTSVSSTDGGPLRHEWQCMCPHTIREVLDRADQLKKLSGQAQGTAEDSGQFGIPNQLGSLRGGVAALTPGQKTLIAATGGINLSNAEILVDTKASHNSAWLQYRQMREMYGGKTIIEADSLDRYRAKIVEYDMRNRGMSREGELGAGEDTGAFWWDDVNGGEDTGGFC